MLEVKGISYRYGTESWLMKDVNLDVKPGEIVGLKGRSGAGKTTLAKIISGYLSPHQGQVIVDSSIPLKQGPHPVQLVWQHPEKVVNPKWRMEKTLLEGGTINEDLLEELKIKREWLKRRPSELSGGELQRICLARVLGSLPKYIIADEMTTMLDAITQSQIWHAFLRLVEQRNIGVIAISHDNDLLDKICGRMVDFEQLKKVEKV